jgi:hypothetical protein
LLDYIPNGPQDHPVNQVTQTPPCKEAQQEGRLLSSQMRKCTLYYTVLFLIYRTGQALTDLSKLPGEFCKVTGHQQSQNNTVQPKQEVTTFANGTTHIDSSELADNITQFHDDQTKVSSNATAMYIRSKQAGLEDKFVESRMAFETGFQDLVTKQHDLKQSLADLETQDTNGIATVRSGLSKQGWSEDKADSILELIKGDIKKEMFIVEEEEKAEE